MRIIAGDVGGTKTLLQICEVRSGAATVVVERRFEAAVYPTFDAMFREFTALDPGVVDGACLGVAGPVFGRGARITNLGWEIDADHLEKTYQIRRALLVNDFFAVAAGVPHLVDEDLVTVNAGIRDRNAPIGILGAGTGLGEAIVVPDGRRWRVVPTEGGHTDFGPQNAQQRELLAALEERYGHVSYERLLSGHGLVNIFTFLRDRKYKRETSPRDLTADDVSLPAAIAADADRGDPLAQETFDLFIDIYGAEAGNLALKTLARGGIYIAGGIATKHVARFLDGRFMRAFAAKGRFESLMHEIPVDLIANSKVGLVGAAAIAIDASGRGL
ncbi:MAG: glucokinase [Thermoanaerobaculia bacterium]